MKRAALSLSSCRSAGSALANAADAVFCGQLAEEAAHAGMAGKTGMVVGLWLNRFTHVPLTAATSGRKTISLERQVRIAAGSLVLIGALLTWLVHPYFLALPTFIGAGLVFDDEPIGIVVERGVLGRKQRIIRESNVAFGSSSEVLGGVEVIRNTI